MQICKSGSLGLVSITGSGNQCCPKNVGGIRKEKEQAAVKD